MFSIDRAQMDGVKKARWLSVPTMRLNWGTKFELLRRRLRVFQAQPRYYYLNKAVRQLQNLVAVTNSRTISVQLLAFAMLNNNYI